MQGAILMQGQTFVQATSLVPAFHFEPLQKSVRELSPKARNLGAKPENRYAACETQRSTYCAFVDPRTWKSRPGRLNVCVCSAAGNVRLEDGKVEQAELRSSTAAGTGGIDNAHPGGENHMSSTEDHRETGDAQGSGPETWKSSRSSLPLSLQEEFLLKSKAEEMSAHLRGTSIFLVGMMGSGKSTVGKVLAEALGYCFFDSDSIVEEASGGSSVVQIFSESGEEAFREAEGQVLAQLSSMLRLVVATGGGAVMRGANWGSMRAGVTVWLNVPVEVLAMRVAGSGASSRPILRDNFVSETSNQTEQEQQPRQAEEDDSYKSALERLSLIFEERQALYCPADATVSLQSIAEETEGGSVHAVSPRRIALQVLREIDVLIQRRKLEDGARLQSQG
eukprot:TRINITY_DN38433_c0_g1_i1.p1 TRINITY_DN38433_c0_g1~~TRINITY_DN38433_c0_g1_i1.p1  ORF type:complete len:393 (-),score=52.86 TRINITY_DN38433_c0_g1_i1:596-1774(-)